LNTSARFALALVVNGITVYGVFVLGWSVATALALYWSENVATIALLALLFALHRIVTHKRGHNRGYLKAFLSQSIAFTFFHGLFLSIFIFKLFPEMPSKEEFNWPQFKMGMMMIGSVLLLRFLVDAAMLKSMSFAALRSKAESFMSRVVIVHLTIIFGMIAMVVSGRPRAMFAVFAAIKLALEVVPVTEPKVKPKEQQAALAQQADDELVQA